MKKVLKITLWLMLAAPFFPPLVRVLTKPEPRAFEWVTLKDTRYTEVAFKNTAQGIGLAGMLFVPEGQGPFPGAVIIHGSGTSRRDSGWYLTLVRYLQEHGVAVLLPDKRGSEGSGGDWHTASFEDLATDAVAALRFLREQDQVPLSRIGIIGMSQGGWIAPIVAHESADVSFVVSVVASSVSTHEQLVYEEDHNLRAMGILPGLSKLLAYVTTYSLRKGRQRSFWDAVGDFDPIPLWAQVSVPTLALFGAEDTNVPTIESARRFATLGNPNITVKIFEGSGHPLEDPPGRGNSVFRKEALEMVRTLIR